MFISYFRRVRRWILMVCCFLLIMISVFLLNDVEPQEVVYAVFVCFFLFLVIGFVDYGIYVGRHKRITELENSITVTLEDMPETREQLELDYQKLIEIMAEHEMQVWNTSESNRKDMEEYFAMWVHQIKTPIAAMKLLIQLEAGTNSAEMSEELFRIEQYVEMMLQYMRLNSDSSDYVFKKQPLDPIVKEVVHKYAKQFIRRKIKLDYTSVEGEIVSDAKWVGFVIEQILSNALKYTKNGTISIYMEKENVLVIEDTGIGISAEDLPRVFEKGYTGFNGHNDKHSTGIGLYLCKRILTKLSHKITGESVVGQGTKVKIDFSVEEVGKE